MSTRRGGALLALTMFLGSCGGVLGPSQDALAGHYRVSSGDSAGPLADALTRRFAALHPGVVFDLESVGSSAAIALLSRGQTDLGFVTRDLKPEEDQLVSVYALGYLGQAVVVNASNPVGGLTLSQVRGIFSGEIVDWSAVGGDRGPVTVFVREPGSSTREAFAAALFAGADQFGKGAIRVSSATEMSAAVAGYKGAIGMLTVAPKNFADARVRALAIDGAAPNSEDVQTGRYLIRRPILMLYGANRSMLRPGVSAFIDFVRGPEGQRIVFDR